MNVGELKAQLINCPDDMEVVICADHGQSIEKAWSAEPIWVKEIDTYNIEVLDAGEEGEWPEAVQVFEISS
jgi:hypothetical protein